MRVVKPPVAPKFNHVHTDHGINRVDQYAWLKNKSDTAVIDYLNSENAYCQSAMSHTEALRSELAAELLGRIQEDDQSAPVVVNKWQRYARTEKGKAYTIYCRKGLGSDSEEQITLDENERANGQAYYSTDTIAYSPDQTKIAWLEDLTGGESYRLWVKDIATGRIIDSSVSGLKWGLCWGDNSTLFYTKGDHAERPYQIWSRALESGEEKLVWEEKDERFFLSISRSKDGQYVCLSAWSKVTTEVRLVPTNDLSATPTAVLPRTQGEEYSIASGGDDIFVRTNRTGPNFAVFRLVDGGLNPILEHNSDRLITGISAFKTHVVISARQGGLQQILIWDRRSKSMATIPFPDPAYELGGSSNPNYDADGYRYAYSSPIRQRTVFSTAFETLDSKVLKVTPIPGGHQPADYQCERIWVTARDGVEIPVTIARRKQQDNGPKPLILYGYGSYGYSYDAGFRSSWLSLMDRGVSIAIAHIRGGSEMGRHWYENGKFFNKKNTFNDFIDCADHLVNVGLTQRRRLAITGGSAGGLLMGAVLNQRPDLCQACVSRVPFVDVVNTMMDPNLPLTVIEYEEWGDPNQRDVFDYMLSYSPYDNIEAKAYPAMLVTAGLNDPRVGYWEPAKMVAKLRQLKTDNNLLLLRTNMDAGHGGASGRYGHIEDTAWMFAFVLDQVAST